MVVNMLETSLPDLTIPEPSSEQLDIATVLGALADPVRLAYVRDLFRSGTEKWCGQILKDSNIDISKSTLSHHLRVLRAAGLTRTRVEGTRRYVTLRRDELDATFPGFLEAVCQTPQSDSSA